MTTHLNSSSISLCRFIFSSLYFFLVLSSSGFSSSDSDPARFLRMFLVYFSSFCMLVRSSSFMASFQSLSQRIATTLGKRIVTGVPKAYDAMNYAPFIYIMRELHRESKQQSGRSSILGFQFPTMQLGRLLPSLRTKCLRSCDLNCYSSSPLQPVPTLQNGTAQATLGFSGSIFSMTPNRNVVMLSLQCPPGPIRQDRLPKYPPRMRRSRVSVMPSIQSPFILIQFMARSLGMQGESGSLSMRPSSLRSMPSLNSFSIYSYLESTLYFTTSSLPSTSVMTLSSSFFLSLSGMLIRLISSFSFFTHSISNTLQQSCISESCPSATTLFKPKGIILRVFFYSTMISPSRMHESHLMLSLRMGIIFSQTWLQSTPFRENTLICPLSVWTCNRSPSNFVYTKYSRSREFCWKYFMLRLPASIGRMGWNSAISSLREVYRDCSLKQVSLTLFVRLKQSLPSGWKVLSTMSTFMLSFRSFRIIREIHLISSALDSLYSSLNTSVLSSVLSLVTILSRISFNRLTVSSDFWLQTPLITSWRHIAKSPIPTPPWWQLGFLKCLSLSYCSFVRLKHYLTITAKFRSLTPQLPRSRSSAGRMSLRTEQVNSGFLLFLKMTFTKVLRQSVFLRLLSVDSLLNRFTRTPNLMVSKREVLMVLRVYSSFSDLAIQLFMFQSFWGYQSQNIIVEIGLALIKLFVYILNCSLRILIKSDINQWADYAELMVQGPRGGSSPMFLREQVTQAYNK